MQVPEEATLKCCVTLCNTLNVSGLSGLLSKMRPGGQILNGPSSSERAPG